MAEASALSLSGRPVTNSRSCAARTVRSACTTPASGPRHPKSGKWCLPPFVNSIGFNEMFLSCKSILWRSLACGLFTAAIDPCFTQTLTGVVYYENSGPSGKGAGQIDLVVGEKVWQLQYRKLLVTQFSGSSCEDVGAVWVVDVSFGRGPMDGRITRAICTGKVDEQVRGS